MQSIGEEVIIFINAYYTRCCAWCCNWDQQRLEIQMVSHFVVITIIPTVTPTPFSPQTLRSPLVPPGGSHPSRTRRTPSDRHETCLENQRHTTFSLNLNAKNCGAPSPLSRNLRSRFKEEGTPIPHVTTGNNLVNK
ncbi:hypothetical protein FRC19_001994 [Serendipita sp. 401]|nr:hypothetical protein FRC19_001994 [Serendipita sp. 401]